MTANVSFTYDFGVISFFEASQCSLFAAPCKIIDWLWGEYDGVILITDTGTYVTECPC